MKVVPRPLVLLTVKPLTVVWDRSSVESAVTNLSFIPQALKDWTPAMAESSISRVILSAPADAHMRQRIRGQVVRDGRRRPAPLIVVKIQIR